MHPALERGGHPNQCGPVAQQATLVADGLGAIQASGSNSARSSWARVRASTRSSLSLAEAIALQRLGWTRCGSSSSSSSSSASQPQP